MASASKRMTRRIIVVVVPPVDELALVGPLQVVRRAFVRLLGITPRRYRELGEPSRDSPQRGDNDHRTA
jgi:hypothetical protein